MAKRSSEETKNMQIKKRKQKSSEEDIYKIDFEPIEEQENIVKNPPKSKRGRKKKEEKKFEFDDVRKNEMIANIDLMRERIEQGQKIINELGKTRVKKEPNKQLKEEFDVEELYKDEAVKEKKTRKRRTKIAKEEKDEGILTEILKKETKTRKRRTKKVEVQQDVNEGIKINAQNGVTEVFLDDNQYRIEMQKSEFNIYTKYSGSSYIIVRDNELKMLCDDEYLLLKKENQD